MDLAAQKGIRLWVLDLASPGVLEMMRKGMAAHLTTAPMQFALFPAPDPRKLGRIALVRCRTARTIQIIAAMLQAGSPEKWPPAGLDWQSVHNLLYKLDTPHSWQAGMRGDTSWMSSRVISARS
jgi:hypothetical protein